MSVLVVDRDPATCEMLRDFLALEGFAVRCEHDPERAWAAIQHERPRVIVLEVVTPAGPTAPLLDRIVILDPPIPVVVMGFDLLPSIPDARAVTKPFDLDDLLVALQRSLGSEQLSSTG